MATIEDALTTYLVSLASVAAYVGTDVFHCAPYQLPDTDYIRYQIINPSNEPYSFVTSDTAQPEIQIDIFSKNDANCLAIGNLIASALNRFTGTLATGINVIFSTASGPMVMRDASDEQWWHGIVYWNPEYER